MWGDLAKWSLATGSNVSNKWDLGSKLEGSPWRRWWGQEVTVASYSWTSLLLITNRSDLSPGCICTHCKKVPLLYITVTEPSSFSFTSEWCICWSGVCGTPWHCLVLLPLIHPSSSSCLLIISIFCVCLYIKLLFPLYYWFMYLVELLKWCCYMYVCADICVYVLYLYFHFPLSLDLWLLSLFNRKWTRGLLGGNPASWSGPWPDPRLRSAWAPLPCCSLRWSSTVRAVCTLCLSCRHAWQTWVRTWEPACWMCWCWERRTGRGRPKFWTCCFSSR